MHRWYWLYLFGRTRMGRGGKDGGCLQKCGVAILGVVAVKGGRGRMGDESAVLCWILVEQPGEVHGGVQVSSCRMGRLHSQGRVLDPLGAGDGRGCPRAAAVMDRWMERWPRRVLWDDRRRESRWVMVECRCSSTRISQSMNYVFHRCGCCCSALSPGCEARVPGGRLKGSIAKLDVQSQT